MSKISAFVVGTVGLSLAILIPTYVFFETAVIKLEEAGLIVSSSAAAELRQGFAILAFLVIVSVVTLMTLIVFRDGENHVVR